MNKFILIVGALVISMLLASCSHEGLMEKLTPEKEAKLAEDLLTQLRAKDLENIKSKLSDEVKHQATDEVLLELSDYFRSGELISTTIIGSQVHVINGVWHGNFSFEYQFVDGWNLANAAIRKVDDSYEIFGLNVYQTEKSQKEIHAFTLSGKQLKHYLVLLLAVSVPLFILITTIYCIRTPIQKRKWLWVLFILVGVTATHLNWTTGDLIFQPLSINLFGAAAIAASPYSAWNITAAFPLGAIMFWFKRRRFIEDSKDEEVTETSKL